MFPDFDPGSQPVHPVPQQRIAEKLNEYMSRKDYPAVERHLLYWLEEARQGNDPRGALMIRNEMIGHYRKTGERQKAHESAGDALRLIQLLGYEQSISAATTYVNIATAYHSFDEYAEALPLFRQARAIYEASPATDPALLGGLYNNMGLTCAALGQYQEAHALYDRAMEVMEQVPHGNLEQSITCLNRANAVEMELGMDRGEPRIFELLDQASALMEKPDTPHDGYYAYVCEHSAPTFEYYGYFLCAETLRREARNIYERA